MGLRRSSRSAGRNRHDDDATLIDAPLADPTHGDPGAEEVRLAADVGDLDRVTALLRASASQEDLDLRFAAVMDAAEGGARDIIESWARRRPDEPLAHIAKGAILMRKAWRSQGGRWATELPSPDRLERVWALMRDAERVLQVALRHEPRVGVAWVELLDALSGMSAPLEEIELVFSYSERACGSLPPAQSIMLRANAPQNGGSVERMLTYARALSARAPVGDPSHAAIAEALLEWSFLDPERAANPAAVQEVQIALQRSGVDQPNRGSHWDHRARNLFALTAYRLGDEPTAKHLLTLIGIDGRGFTNDPWERMGEPGTVFAEIGSYLGAW